MSSMHDGDWYMQVGPQNQPLADVILKRNGSRADPVVVRHRGWETRQPAEAPRQGG